LSSVWVQVILPVWRAVLLSIGGSAYSWCQNISAGNRHSRSPFRYWRFAPGGAPVYRQSNCRLQNGALRTGHGHLWRDLSFRYCLCIDRSPHQTDPLDLLDSDRYDSHWPGWLLAIVQPDAMVVAVFHPTLSREHSILACTHRGTLRSRDGLVCLPLYRRIHV